MLCQNVCEKRSIWFRLKCWHDLILLRSYGTNGEMSRLIKRKKFLQHHCLIIYECNKSLDCGILTKQINKWLFLGIATDDLRIHSMIRRKFKRISTMKYLLYTQRLQAGGAIASPVITSCLFVDDYLFPMRFDVAWMKGDSKVESRATDIQHATYQLVVPTKIISEIKDFGQNQSENHNKIAEKAIKMNIPRQ